MLLSPPAPPPVDADQPTTSGLAPETAAALAYVLWWVTGLLFLAIDRRHPFVRFHAAQAVVAFGSLWLLGVTLWATSFLVVFLAPGLLALTVVAGQLVWALGFVLSAVCGLLALRGRLARLPLAGEWAARWAARRESDPD